jgi:hypothetical protein
MKNRLNYGGMLSITLLVFLLVSSHAQAGRLGEFERDATQPENKPSPPIPSSSAPSPSETEKKPDSSDTFDELLWDLFFLPFEYGGISSYLRVSSQPVTEEEFPHKIEKRQLGEPVIPFTRMDIHLQHIASNLFAVDSRAEFGYGPFGLQVRHTDYKEKDPSDHLNITQASLLYRMSFSKYVEVDVGLGQSFIAGEGRHSGFLATFPIQIQTGHPLGFQFRPAFYQGIEDYDMGLLFTQKSSSYLVGYRRVVAGESRLSGPYIGAAFHY